MASLLQFEVANQIMKYKIKVSQNKRLILNYVDRKSKFCVVGSM